MQPLDPHPAPSRRRVEPRKMAHRPVPIMAEKALVPAIAVQRDGDLATRHFGVAISRDRWRIGQRLATVPDEARQHADGVGFDNPLLIMIGSIAFRHL
jgi:hypothetical protein